MRRQVLSRVWAAVGARSLRGAGGPGSAPARSRGTVQSFCPAGDLHRFLSRGPRGGHWQEHQASGSWHRRHAASCAQRPRRAARRRDTHRPASHKKGVSWGRGWLRAGPAHCEVKHAAGVWLVKMFDVDPSYFQGMKVVPVSRRTRPLSRAWPLPLAFLRRAGEEAADGCGLTGPFSEFATS